MKPRVLIPLVAVVAGAAGFFAGMWWKQDAAPPAEAAAGTRRTVAPPPVIPGSNAAPRATKEDPGFAKTAVAQFTDLNSRADTLTAEQFGQRYAELMAGTDSTASLLERAAMLSAITPERAAACYLAYKKRVGASWQQNTQEIRHLLTVAGERDGAATIAALQKAAPGFQELSSLLHGWAMKDPQAAVDWYNTLPEGDAQRKTGLDGLMWGLSQRDAGTAGTVFRALSAEDQLTSGRSLGRALFTSQGGEEINRLIEGLPPEVAQQCLLGASERAYRRAPAETVPWLAAHLGASPVVVDESFVNNWSRWRTADPGAAEQWRVAAVQDNPRIASLLEPPQESIER